MKKWVTLGLLCGACACNSGNSGQSTASDTTAAKMVDTSHNMPAMTPQEAMTPVPADAKVYFKNLKDGQTVSSPVTIEMGVVDMSVDSAGKIRPQSGHFHLLVDAGDSTPHGIVIGKDSAHIHFGNAQKETTLALKPGIHTLALQFADGLHRSYGAQLSQAIHVTVK